MLSVLLLIDSRVKVALGAGALAAGVGALGVGALGAGALGTGVLGAGVLGAGAGGVVNVQKEGSPIQVYQFSTLQLESHPSPLAAFASSQFYPIDAEMKPSPQKSSVQTDG